MDAMLAKPLATLTAAEREALSQRLMAGQRPRDA
jgi:hypothetical protein